MERLPAIAHAIDRLSRWAGLFATVMVLTASLLSAFNAFFRYGLGGIAWALGDIGGIVAFYRANSNTMGEAQWYMFAAMVMFGAAWTLKMNGHVRVDLFYGWVSERTRTWIDLLGGIFFLVPMCVLMIRFTWPWFVESFVRDEASSNAGGLMRWPVKLCLPAGFGFVLLQGIAEILKCLAALTTPFVREHAYEKPVQ